MSNRSSELALLLTVLLAAAALVGAISWTSAELVVLLLAYGGIWIVLLGLGLGFGLGAAVRKAQRGRRTAEYQKKRFRMMNDS